MTAKHGRWSLMSLIMIVGSILLCNFVLRNILSIKVALLVVILVGFDMVGKRFLFKFTSRNSFVWGCW